MISSKSESARQTVVNSKRCALQKQSAATLLTRGGLCEVRLLVGQLILLPTAVTIRGGGVAVMEYVSLPALTITMRSSIKTPGPGTN